MKFNDIPTKSGRIAYIREALGTDPKWAVRGLLRIYQNQTEDEKRVEETNHENGIGFTGADANILTSFAKQVGYGRTMSPKQMALLFKKMPKYAKQLESVSYKPLPLYKADLAEEVTKGAKDIQCDLVAEFMHQTEAYRVEQEMNEMEFHAELEAEAKAAWSSMR